MNIKVLSVGITITMSLILLQLTAKYQFQLSYTNSMMILISLSFVAWFSLLRKHPSLTTFNIEANLLQSILPLLMVLIGIPAFLFLTTENINYTDVASSLSNLLLGSVYEELLFRLIALSTFLSAGMKPIKAILLSSIIFSVSHALFLPNIEWSILKLFLDTFIVGLVLGVVYYRSKNLLLVIVIHFLWNTTILTNKVLASEDVAISTTIILFAITILYFFWAIKELRNTS